MSDPVTRLNWKEIGYHRLIFHLKHEDNIFVSSVIVCSSIGIYITYNNEKKSKQKLDLISLRNMTISGISGIIFGTFFVSTSYFSIPVAVISGGIILINNTFLK